MIDELKDLLSEFSGAASRTRCFAHIINLVAKTVIHQFDMRNASDNALADEILMELKTLAENIEAEELMTRAGESEEDDADGEDDDNVEGWVDEREEMAQWDLEELEMNVQPLRKVLVKVRTNS